MRIRHVVFLSLTISACSQPPASPATGAAEQAVWTNGDFEADAIGTTPPTGWTISKNVTPSGGLTDTRPNPQTLASLNLATGGVLMTFVVGGAAESQSDPDVTSAGTLRYPKYGTRATRVNYQASTNTTTNGANTNVNSLKQQMTVGIGDVDPSDNKVHVRFAIAPVLENPGHAYTQQPYYFVRLQNLTRNATIYQDFNASGQTGVPWKNFTTPAGNAAQYTDWQLVDIAPGNAALAVGDDVELLVIAAGCNQGGHFGRVYVDAVGSGIPGLFTWATGVQNANAGTDVTYTLNYKNGGTTTTNGTKIDLVTPPNTTYKSTTGSSCTAPAVGATGTVSCTLGSVSPGGTGSYTITVNVNAATANGTVITNGNYSIYATGVSALVGPKVQTTVTSGVTYSDLSITKSDGIAAIGWGQPLTYTIGVANAGPATTTATVTDTMPAQLTGVTWTCTATGTATCTAAGSGSISDAVSLASGASLTYTVNANIVAGSGNGSVVNTATVAATGSSTDPDSTNNSAVDSDTIGTLRTLTLTKQGTISAGSIASSPAAISCGTGCSSATADFLDSSQVVLTATPASGATFVGWGGACSGTATTCNVTMAGAQSVTATFAGAAAATGVSSGSPQSATILSAFANPLAVLVTDASGTPVPGVTVTFAAPGSGASATLSAATAVTNASGIASVTATANGTAGAYSVTGTVAGITPAASFALSNIGVPSTIAVSSGSGQSATVGVGFGASLVAIVRDAANQPVPGVTVTFAAPGSGARATLSSTTATTNAAGLATITATAGTVAGSYAVTASTSGVATPASFSLTNLAGAAATLAVSSGSSQSVRVGTAFAAPLVARVSDAFNNPVSGVTVTFTPPGSGATASVAPTTMATNASGLAQTTATASNTAGSYSVTASASGLTSVTFALTNTAGLPAAIAISSGNNQSATVRTAFAQSLAALVTDSFGNPVSGATVTFTAPGAGASATVSSATTNASGIASAPATANAIAGAYSVTAAVTGGGSVGFALTNTAAAPATVTITGGGGQTATVGAAFAQPIAVLVVDADNNPVSGVTVTLTGPGSGAGLATSPIMITTGAAGTASSPATANHTTGSYSVSARVTGVAIAPTVTLTNGPGAVATLTATAGSGQSTVVLTAFATQLAIHAVDPFGNAVPGATITFSAPGTGASATFPGAGTATTNASGNALITATANGTAGAFSAQAASGSATPASFALTNLAGAASQIALVDGTPQQAAVTAAFGAPLRVRVSDAQGNPVSGATVSFSAPGTGATATLSSATTTTASTGIASITATAGTVAGGYTVSATTAGAATPVSFALTNLAGAAATLAISSGNNQAVRVTNPFAAPLVVRAADAQGNAVAGVVVTFSAPGTGASASLAPTSATTNASGLAQTTATAGTVTGAYSVTASATGLTSIGFALTNTAGLPAAIAISSGNNQSATVRTAFAQSLAALVTDSNGNPVPGATVTFTAPGAGASATVNSATTNASGIASAPATANAIAGAYSVTAAVTGGGSVGFALTNTAAAPATVTITGGGGQTATVGAAFAQPIAVLVADADGNPVSGVTVTLTGPGTGAGLATSPITVTTGAAGTASSTVTANHTTGSYSVSARVTGVAIAPTITLTNGPGAATTLAVVSGDAQHAAVTTAYASPLVVLATDAFGNNVPGASVTFSAPASSGASATFAPTTTTTGSNGRASTTATAGTHSGAFIVTATSGAASTTFHLTNDPGAAAAIAVSSGSPQSAVVQAAFGAPLIVHVTDAQGNDVPGQTVTFAAPGTGARATLAATTVTTGATGLAQTTATAGTVTGSYAVTATIPGPHVASFQLSNTAGTVATLTATGGGGQSAVVLTAFATALSIHAVDQFGNVVPNATITYAAPSNANATFAGAGVTTTDASGNAQIIATAGTAAGSYTAQASAGSAAPATFALTNLPGEAAQIAVVDGTPQSATVAMAFGAPLRVLVSDAQGNPVPGATVHVTPATSPASATPSAAIAIADGSGIAFVGATANTVSGSYDLTASVGEGASVAFHLTNLADVPAAIVVDEIASPQAITVLQMFTNPLLVTVQDKYGNPTPGATVTYSVPATGASATLSALTATTDASGHASVTATATSKAGSYHAFAAVDGVADAAPFALSNLVGAPAMLAVSSGDPQTAVVDTNFAAALVVQVLDASGNPVPGVVVAFSAPDDGATAVLMSSSAMTDAGGLASMPARAGTVTGSYTVTASFGGAAAPVTFHLSNTPGAAATITASLASTPQNAQVDHPFAQPLTAVVRDSFGNAVPGVVVAYVAPATGATGALSSATATSGADGSVSVTLEAGTTAGSYTVTATATGVATAAVFTLGNLPGEAQTIVASAGTPQAATVASAFAAPIVALVRDAHGNPVPGVTVTFAAPATGATATLAQTTAVTAADGTARTELAAATIAGAFVVTATAPSGASPASFALTARAGAPATIAALGSATPQSAAVMTTFGQPLAVTVLDSYGNPVPGAHVTYTAPSAPGAELSATSATTDDNGTASVLAIADHLAGTYSVTVALEGTSGATFALTNTAAPPSSVLITAGGAQHTLATTAFAAPVAARVIDSFGNPVAGIHVTFTAPATGASAMIATPAQVTDDAGDAAVTLTAGPVVGTFLLSVQADGATGAATTMLEALAIPTTITAMTDAAASVDDQAQVTISVTGMIGVPTGIVDIAGTDGTHYGSAMLSDGAAVVTTAGLPRGTHTLVATYAAQGSYAASTSTAVTVEITGDTGSLSGGTGGGCNTGRGSAGGWLVLVLGALLVRRRRKAAVVAGVALCVAASAGSAVADPDGARAINRYHAASPDSAWFALDSATFTGNGDVALSVVTEYAKDPLETFEGDGTVRQHVVTDTLTLQLGASVTLRDRVRLSASVPLVPWQTGHGGTFNGMPLSNPKYAFGDVELGGDVRVLGGPGDPLRLAVGLRFALPTGSRTNFTSDGTLGTEPHVDVAGSLGRLEYAGAASAFLRSSSAMAGEKFGHELRYEVGAGVKLAERRLLIGPELFGATALQSDTAVGSPLEIQIGAHFAATRDVRLGVAVGKGLINAVGEPTWRGLASLVWAP